MTDIRGGPFSNQWAMRPRWKTAHFVLATGRTLWLGEMTGRTACGRIIAINDGLEPPPAETGYTLCSRCNKRLPSSR